MRTARRAGALAALAFLTATCFTSPAFASAADYVVTPIVEEGEKEIDFKAGTAKYRDGSRESAWSVGLGYGVNSWWFTEVYAKQHHEPGEQTKFDAWEWENRFQLTETGKYPVDIGVLLEIERPKDRTEGYEITGGPLFQMDFTPKVQGNLNLLVTKHVRAENAAPAEFGYQWQVKYRAQEALEYGVQGFGDVGPLSHFAPSSEQSHTAGPALFGVVRVGPKEKIRWNAGLLFGVNNAAPRNTLRLQAEYEF